MSPTKTTITLEVAISGTEREAWGLLMKALCGSKGWSLVVLAKNSGVSYDRIKASAAGKIDLTHAEAEEILQLFEIVYLAVATGDRFREEVNRRAD